MCDRTCPFAVVVSLRYSTRSSQSRFESRRGYRVGALLYPWRSMQLRLDAYNDSTHPHKYIRSENLIATGVAIKRVCATIEPTVLQSMRPVS